MNFVKTTALLTLMTLVVMFSASAFGFELKTQNDPKVYPFEVIIGLPA